MLESPKTKNAEMRDGNHDRIELCSLGHDWVRDSRVSDLSHTPTLLNLKAIQPNADSQPVVETVIAVK